MTVDNADEVMAEYLLKGGKMLAKSCKICGYPLFEYKGETQCVICPVLGSKAPSTESEPVREVPPELVQAPSPAPAAPAAKDRVVDELEQTIIHLCERIRGEPRADECLTLMKAVAKGAAALAALAQR